MDELNLLVAGTAALWAVVIAMVGGRLTVIDHWYHNLKKPGWKPPDWAFGMIWTAVFIMSATALYRGWVFAPDQSTQFLIVLLFVINGVLNIAWNILFFTWRRPDWALPETYLLIASIILPALVIGGFDVLGALLLVPYALWVSIACYLTYEIVALNRPFYSRTEAA